VQKFSDDVDIGARTTTFNQLSAVVSQTSFYIRRIYSGSF